MTDYYGILSPQADLDFAIPFFDEDIPLYVDPFLLWRSPSQQDQALHTSLINAFNHLGHLVAKGEEDQAIATLIAASECDEVGLGSSAKRRGKRIGRDKAQEILALFKRVPHYLEFGFHHFEEIQFFVDGISKDRISDITCSFLKSFLIDFKPRHSRLYTTLLVWRRLVLFRRAGLRPRTLEWRRLRSMLDLHADRFHVELRVRSPFLCHSPRRRGIQYSLALARND